MLMLFDLESLCFCQSGYFLEVLQNHHDIQVQADHGLDIGVNGEPSDHTISGVCLGKRSRKIWRISFSPLAMLFRNVFPVITSILTFHSPGRPARKCTTPNVEEY